MDNSLLCELAAHPDFPRLMADLEIYVNGVAGKQVQSANAIVDAVSATIMKQHNPGLTDPQLRQLIAAHIDEMCIRDRADTVQFVDHYFPHKSAFDVPHKLLELWTLRIFHVLQRGDLPVLP